ncbi:MAG: ABC transporter substrate-binding protein [Nibricoccus sp.]
MKKLVLLFAWVFLLFPVQEAGAGLVRVVSQTVGTDELLLAVADPSQIAALSHLARDPAFSAISEEAKRFPQLPKNCDLEGALRFGPTVLLCADYSRAEIVAQARRAGLKVIVIDRYHTLADAYGNLRLIARELGPEAEARAEHLIADCEKRVADLHERLKGVKPVRVISPSTYGVIPGYDSTFQDICEHAGAENLAATLGGLHGHAAPPVEQMLTWPIDRVVVVGESVEEALKVFKNVSPYEYMPVIRENRGVLLKPYLISTVTHWRVEAYEMLARALHPERFQ